jgi:uncharacterized membrane protein HdeD (DUF308 family)
MSSQSFTNDEIRESTSTWWLFLLMGLVAVAAGVVVLTKPSDSLTTLAVIAGILVLIEGIFELSVAMKRRTENRAHAAIIGALSAVVGVLLIRHPVGGVLAVALLIGIWLITIGIVRLAHAFDREHRAWNIGVGLVQIVAGIVIVASPPIAFSTLALLVGIAFIVNGVALFAIGWMMHALRTDEAGHAPAAGVPA